MRRADSRPAPPRSRGAVGMPLLAGLPTVWILDGGCVAARTEAARCDRSHHRSFVLYLGFNDGAPRLRVRGRQVPLSDVLEVLAPPPDPV